MPLTGRLGTPTSTPGNLQPGNPGAAPAGGATYSSTVSTTQSQSVARSFTVTIAVIPIRETQAELVVLRTDLGAVRETQAVLVALIPVRSVQTSTTQAQAVSLGRSFALTRTITQAQSLQVAMTLAIRRVVTATQAQVVARARSISLFRRISQSQTLKLPIGKTHQFKRTVTARQSEAATRAALQRSVSATQAQSVRLVRQPRLIRTATQPVAVRVVRGLQHTLQTAQTTTVAYLIRSSAALLKTTQSTAAALKQDVSLQAIVSQVALAEGFVQARLTRAVQQLQTAVLSQRSLPREQVVSTTVTANVSLIKAPAHIVSAQQAQIATLVRGAAAVRSVAQPQACSLLILAIPVGGIQPVEVFTTCHARRTHFAAPVRRTTFQTRPRELVATARRR